MISFCVFVSCADAYLPGWEDIALLVRCMIPESPATGSVACGALRSVGVTVLLR